MAEKSNNEKRAYPLRISGQVLEAMQRWSEDELRSVNAQIEYVEELSYTLSYQAREGDHIWWVSDVRKFQQDYPDWNYEHDLRSIITEIVEATAAKRSEEMLYDLAAA